MFSGPTWKDWLLAAISIAFVVISLLPGNGQRPVFTLVVFGMGSVFGVGNIFRKIRERRFTSDEGARAELTGGVEIGPDNSQRLSVGLALAVGGALTVWLEGEGHRVEQAMGGFLLLVGIAVVVGHLANLLPRQTIQFDPEGLRFGLRGCHVRVPWDAIAILEASEYASNPILLFQLRDLAAVQVEPAGAESAFLKQLTKNRTWIGTDLALMPRNFGMDTAPLLAALQRYRRLPETRSELRRNQISD